MIISDKTWYTSRVIHGNRIGTTMGYPTLNLNPDTANFSVSVGVYACLVDIKDQIYGGMLYFGPRFIIGEEHNILEIYLFNFHQKVYGESISFLLIEFVRPTVNFKDLATLKKQLQDDEEKTKKILSLLPK